MLHPKRNRKKNLLGAAQSMVHAAKKNSNESQKLLDDRLIELFSKLPLDGIDDDVWDLFLQSEKMNDLIEPLIVIEYAHKPDCDLSSLLVSEDDDAKNSGSISYRSCSIVGEAFQHIIDIILTEANYFQSDSSFWQTLRQVSFFSTSLSPPQALLLLVVQCIFDRDLILGNLAARLFMLLCQFPQATENFFSPNLFIFRKIVSPLSQILKQPSLGTSKCEVATTCSDDDDDNNDTDDESQKKKKKTETAYYSSRFVMSIQKPLIKFLKSACSTLLHLESGRVIMTLCIEHLTEIALKCLNDEMRLCAKKGILEFMMCLDKLRSRPLQFSSLDETNSIDTSNNFYVPICPGGPQGTPLLFGCNSFFRNLTMSLVGRGSLTATGFGNMCKLQTIIATEKREAMQLLIDLAERVPVLLDPIRLSIDGKTVAEDSDGDGIEDASDNDLDNDDVDEETSRHINVGRRHRHAALVSDDEEANPHADNNDNRPTGDSGDEAEILLESKSTDSHEAGLNTTKKSLAKTNHIKKSKKQLQLQKQQLELNATNDPILALLARSCLLAPDRKESREALTVTIKTLLESFGSIEANYTLPKSQNTKSLIERFSLFLLHLLKSARYPWRLLAVETVATALLEPQLTSVPSVATTLPECTTFCLAQNLIRRLRDFQPGIRARTAECIANLISVAATNTDIIISLKLRHFFLGQSLSNKTETTTHNDTKTYTYINAYGMIKDTTMDEKQIVRKASLFLIKAAAESVHNFMLMSNDFEEEEYRSEVIRHLKSLGVLDPTILPKLALDPGILVRSKAISTITDLLGLFPKIKPIQQLWLNIIPTAAVSDVEKTVSDKALESISSIILNSSLSSTDIEQLIESKNNHNSQTSYPQLLDLLSTGTLTHMEYIQHCLAIYFRKESSFPSSFLKLLKDSCRIFTEISKFTKIDKNNKTSSYRWSVPIFHLVQGVVALDKTAIDSHRLYLCWLSVTSLIDNFIDDPKQNHNFESLTTISKSLLLALAAVAQSVSAADKTIMETRILEGLKKFIAPLNVIHPTVLCLVSLSSSSKLKDSQPITDILRRAEAHISSYLEQVQSQQERSKSGTCPIQNVILVTLLTLGELAAQLLATIPSQLTTMLQALITSGSDNQTNVLVRAMALVTMGKICCVNESLAKKLLPFFATQLLDNVPYIIRCNAIVVFSDFCLKFAALTDRFLPQFTACLGSISPLIRKQNLIVLAGLLAQDYLKCKGLVLYRLLVTLGDTHAEIRRFAELVVTNVVMPKHSNFIQNHFIETMCFSCGFANHPVFKPSMVGGWAHLKTSSPFCLLRHPERRQHVYSFFLQHMTDRDRHELSRRIVHAFLTAFVDNDEYSGHRLLDLPKSADEPGGAALRDSLKLLGCKQMKITFDKQRYARLNEPDDETVSGVAAVQSSGSDDNQQAKQTAYELNLLKRNLAYQILPTLLSLKRVMEDARSMFLRDILQCLSALLFDYRTELSDMLFHDPMLAKQLDLDFKHGNNSAVTSQQGGRPSLLLDFLESPRTGAASTTNTATVIQNTAAFNSRPRQGSIQRQFSSNRLTPSMTLPRLRTEVLLSKQKFYEESLNHSEDRNFSHSSVRQRNRSGSLVLIPQSTMPSTTHHDASSDTSLYHIKQEDSPRRTQQDSPSYMIAHTPLLGRTETERIEQESVLTALRSARRRHSLPPISDPVYEERLRIAREQFVNNNSSNRLFKEDDEEEDEDEEDEEGDNNNNSFCNDDDNNNKENAADSSIVTIDSEAVSRPLTAGGVHKNVNISNNNDDDNNYHQHHKEDFYNDEIEKNGSEGDMQRSKIQRYRKRCRQTAIVASSPSSDETVKPKIAGVVRNCRRSKRL